ncbi:DUF2818 family protein [Massilia sp. W12]|uniref:DUF2818 family protein n=1 Tax=Massilia sp. W12 TaxID=3126507 RepID=UPI0030CF2160
MDTSKAAWLVILAGLFFANLPFFTRRLFCVFKLDKQKNFALHMLEWFVFYLLLGLLGAALEGAIGNRAAQGWEFYVITACLMLVFAFPGFVFRYLVKR